MKSSRRAKVTKPIKPSKASKARTKPRRKSKKQEPPATLPATAEPTPPAAAKQVTLNLQVLDQMKGQMKSIGGSRSDDWNAQIADQVTKSLWLSQNPETRQQQLDATVLALHFMKPNDEFEGMLVAQLLGLHHASMESLRRAMLPEQSFVGRQEALNQASKLSRSYAVLLEQLNRHRGKGQQQQIVVKHVTVNADQAIVGDVAPHQGGGAQLKDEEQPHVLGYAPGQTLRSTDTERQALPVAGDAEREVQAARRPITGGAKGK